MHALLFERSWVGGKRCWRLPKCVYSAGRKVSVSTREKGVLRQGAILFALGSSLFVGFILLGQVSWGQDQMPEPVPLIFDTDLGNDVDDAMALALIHALQSRNECRLLAVTLTKDNVYAARFVELMNTFYGRPDIPIGMVRGGSHPEEGRYIRRVAEAEDSGILRYPHRLRSREEVPEATQVLRRVLASQPDRSVVIVQVGFSTNLARLLVSQPDDISPLDGRALAEQKVRLLSVMAGAFSEELQAKNFVEFNVRGDIPAAQKLFADWPTEIVVSGFEIGVAIAHPAQSMQLDYRFVRHHPLREAYDYYRGLANDQPTWDLTAVLYAVRPQHGYFNLSPPGWVNVDDRGRTHFRRDEAGKHRYLIATPQQIIRVREAQALLCSQPPCR
ncbi:MAG: nucleoside hydrolase [Thermoguttaceae bacterium]|nr:nucleoside hydrolase [Thermoguttaceae bacterium]MDW8078609.1 nucleoside hydrolase [Thermoguttaceae bacterium]